MKWALIVCGWCVAGSATVSAMNVVWPTLFDEVGAWWTGLLWPVVLPVALTIWLWVRLPNQIEIRHRMRRAEKDRLARKAQAEAKAQRAEMARLDKELGL